MMTTVNSTVLLCLNIVERVDLGHFHHTQEKKVIIGDYGGINSTMVINSYHICQSNLHTVHAYWKKIIQCYIATICQ